jgi:hypothetical protein
MARPRPFQGFQGPNYTQVPDQLFDELLVELSGAELKVLLYIMRRTFGFKKDSDNISLGQMLDGIRTRDGRQLDRGTGLSKPTLLKALRSLTAGHYIIAVRRQSADHGDESTNYRLNVIDQTADTRDGAGEPNRETPVVKKFDHGVATSLTTPVVKKVPPQETVVQETENVERSRSNGSRNVPSSDERPETETSLFDPTGKPLSPAARAAYEAYRQAAAAGKMPTLDKLGAPRKASAAAQGLTDQEVGLALGLADEIAEVLGARQRNAGYYRTLAFHAIKHRYLPLVRQCLAETKAGDVPRGTVANRPGYFTRVLQAKAKAQGLALPIKPPAQTR